MQKWKKRECSMDEKIVLPRLGESITEATVVRLLIAEGQRVEKDQPLMEVATDKVASEIPSPFAGTIASMVVEEGQTVLVGQLLCTLKLDQAKQNSFLSPRVMHLAAEAGIAIEEVEKLSGSGEKGRITASDLARHIESRSKSVNGSKSHIGAVLEHAIQKVPQATMMVEADLTEMMALIAFNKAKGVRTTPTSYLIKALYQTTKAFPLLLPSGSKMDVGIAIDVENERVKVGVLPDMEDVSIESIALMLEELVRKVRQGVLETLQPAITLTNFGASGALWGTPLLVPPQHAIFGLGAITERPVAHEGSIALRRIGNLLITFDHRQFDGMYAGRALCHLAKSLQKASNLSKACLIP